MRDEGDHDFSYAVTAYPEPFADSRVVLDAEGYNAGLLAVPGRAQLPPLPAVQSDNVRLASVKWAEKGRALILRCCEFRGRAGSACVTLPEGVRGAAKVNLLERQGEPLAVENGRAQFRVRPWEIATLRLEVD
jgi:alpha-mannosidase